MKSYAAVIIAVALGASVLSAESKKCYYDVVECISGSGYCCSDTWSDLDETGGNPFSGIPQYLSEQLGNGTMTAATYKTKLAYFHLLKAQRTVQALKSKKCYYDVVECISGSGYCCSETWVDLDETGGNPFSGIPQYLDEQLRSGSMTASEYKLKLNYFNALKALRSGKTVRTVP